jgi:hypothetical protein
LINTLKTELESLRNSKGEKVVKEIAVDFNKVNDEDLNEIHRKI